MYRTIIVDTIIANRWVVVTCINWNRNNTRIVIQAYRNSSFGSEDEKN
jgi:hypothetical protein